MQYFFLEGTLVKIEDTNVYSTSFKKRVFELLTDEKYPVTVSLEFVNDEVEYLDRFSVKEMVTVAFVIKSNEYQGKTYNTLRAIGITEIINGKIEKEEEKLMKKNREALKLMASIKLNQ
jgi:hypothetical protein